MGVIILMLFCAACESVGDKYLNEYYNIGKDYYNALDHVKSKEDFSLLEDDFNKQLRKLKERYEQKLEENLSLEEKIELTNKIKEKCQNLSEQIKQKERELKAKFDK